MPFKGREMGSGREDLFFLAAGESGKNVNFLLMGLH